MNSYWISDGCGIAEGHATLSDWKAEKKSFLEGITGNRKQDAPSMFSFGPPSLRFARRNFPAMVIIVPFPRGFYWRW
jgi:hypothetical protein